MHVQINLITTLPPRAPRRAGEGPGTATAGGRCWGPSGIFFGGAGASWGHLGGDGSAASRAHAGTRVCTQTHMCAHTRAQRHKGGSVVGTRLPAQVGGVGTGCVRAACPWGCLPASCLRAACELPAELPACLPGCKHPALQSRGTQHPAPRTCPGGLGCSWKGWGDAVPALQGVHVHAHVGTRM